MRREEKQLQALRAWLTTAADQIDADISVKLWNGEIVPLGANARADIVLAINSPQTIRRLIFSPKLMTVFDIFNEGLISVEGGTPLQAIRRWDHMRVVNYTRSLNKMQLAKTLSVFLLKSKGQNQDTGLSYQKTVQHSLSDGRDDKDMVQWHYDISNEFYELFLDPEMSYSSAYFENPNVSLEDAQIAKHDISCKRLRLKPGEKFFDIGCGWGGLVCHAAQHYGVQAYGVTLAQKQYDFAVEKIKRLGLEDKITIELRDYRSVEKYGYFDKIAQIEMFEHVGHDNHDKHFSHIHKLLKPKGLYLHQAFTRMATPNLDDFRKVTPYQDVATKYIFPGGELDYIGMTVTNLERHRFNVHDVEGWREHYQLTLEHWSERLWDNWDAAVAELGEPKTRMWLLYFALFALSFERNTLSVFQTLASKRSAGPSRIPFSRNDLYE